MSPVQLEVIEAYESHIGALKLQLAEAQAGRRIHGSLAASASARAGREDDPRQRYGLYVATTEFMRRRDRDERRIVALENNIAYYEAKLDAYVQGVQP